MINVLSYGIKNLGRTFFLFLTIRSTSLTDGRTAVRHRQTTAFVLYMLIALAVARQKNWSNTIYLFFRSLKNCQPIKGVAMVSRDDIGVFTIFRI